MKQETYHISFHIIKVEIKTSIKPTFYDFVDTGYFISIHVTKSWKVDHKTMQILDN